MTIWDLRRGDADDDRLSPGGRGLRSIILSTLFEFNLLQGALAFLLLILLPALLIGLVHHGITYGAVAKGTVTRLLDELIEHWLCSRYVRSLPTGGVRR